MRSGALAGRIDLAGLHMHIGSQLRSLDPYRRAIAALAQVGDFDVYDLGGGLAVPYVDGDEGSSHRNGSTAWLRPRGPSWARTSRWCSSPVARWWPTPA